MSQSEASATPRSDFVKRWRDSAAAERANYALFPSELCDFLDVPRPQPTVADPAKNAYVFERSVHFQNGDGTTSIGRIDLYKRGCFVLEAKQGSFQKQEDQLSLLAPQPHPRRGTAVRGTVAWDGPMESARGQAEQYARALPVAKAGLPSW